MTNYDMGDPAREQRGVTATDPRLMDPPTDHAAGSRTTDTRAGDSRTTDSRDSHASDTYPANSGNDATATYPTATQAPVAYAQPDDDRHVTVRTDEAPPRMDRIRWASIWAGLAVALALYLFLQLSLVAAGLVDLADATETDAWWSAGAALVAFLIGGVVAGATAVWRDANDGLLHGIVMWAVGVVAVIALAAFGGGVALGSFDTSDVFDDFTTTEVDEAARGDAEEAAGWAIIGLTSALVASALGATIGSKMWPRRRNDVTEIRS